MNNNTHFAQITVEGWDGLATAWMQEVGQCREQVPSTAKPIATPDGLPNVSPSYNLSHGIIIHGNSLSDEQVLGLTKVHVITFVNEIVFIKHISGLVAQRFIPLYICGIWLIF